MADFPSTDQISVIWSPRIDRASKIASAIGAPIYHVYYVFLGRNWPIFAPVRYGVQAVKTWRILRQVRPRVVHVTNPPVLAPLCVAVYCRLNGASFVMDTHSPALFSRKWGWTKPLQRVLARRALVNIVDQTRFRNQFEEWGARAVIVEKGPSMVPYTRQPSNPLNPDSFNILVVNTFAPDEPVLPIIEAAASLPECHFYVTGDLVYADQNILGGAPPNITFTGWLHRDEYWNTVHYSRAVISLTTWPYSLLAGGQDGLTEGKPLILSDQPVLRDYFSRGTVFVDNSAGSIVEGVRCVQQNEDELKREIAELAGEKARLWEERIRALREAVS
jgi:glycosyltransferase involved in cell wall biosynthesis